MRRFLRSTALALALGFYVSAPGPVTGIVFNPAAYADEAGKIPDWIKTSCCGPKDVHHLRPDQVRRVSDEYYEVDGYKERIPAQQALPSQDGDYWIFYRDEPEGDYYSYGSTSHHGASQSGVYCFFVPMAF